MLFYCVFAEEAGFLVDVDDEKTARAAALETVGVEPAHVRAMPGVLGMRVHFDDDPQDPEGEIVEAELLPHVMDLLAAIEDECDAIEVGVTCMSEAEDDKGNVVRCELVAGHPPPVKHRAGPLEWE